MIERGEVYRHIKNLKVFSKEIQKQNPSKQVLPKVDSFLTACLVLTFALVVGLGLGHFLGEHYHYFYHYYYFIVLSLLSIILHFLGEHHFFLSLHLFEKS